jgi:two-component system sensor histidine kinase MprB
VAGGGVVAAAGLGFAVARSALAPVGELTRAAERVAATQELDARIPDKRGDELGRLAAAFNEMLSALEASRTQQRRLVADASHELRTPLTSLRTNIELLAKAPGLPGAEREKLLADVTAELAELGHLVAELVDLAGDPNATQEAATDVRLDELAGQVVERARRRTGTDITLDAEAVVVRGRPAALERAIANLVDNACKWSPAAEVCIRGGMVEVRDRGPGIEPGDRPRVFDRFFRASTARSMPGSGLGLAIVKQAVEAHGGRVWVEENPGGGAVVGFEVPGAERVGG